MSNIPEYPLLCGIAIVVLLIAEFTWVKSGVFRRPAYWLAMAICLSFQILVDGWLTKLSNPIVIYNPDEMLGIRAPWDIPVEDFAFGFVMLTVAIMVWQKLKDRQEQAHETE